MFFILYKPHFLLPYNKPTPKPTLYRKLWAFLLSQKTNFVWFISLLNYGDTENVLINHLLLAIPMSYPCHNTHLCPHKPHKHARTHTHTHTLYHSKFDIVKYYYNSKYVFYLNIYLKCKLFLWFLSIYLSGRPSVLFFFYIHIKIHLYTCWIISSWVK